VRCPEQAQNDDAQLDPHLRRHETVDRLTRYQTIGKGLTIRRWSTVEPS